MISFECFFEKKKITNNYFRIYRIYFGQVIEWETLSEREHFGESGLER